MLLENFAGNCEKRDRMVVHGGGTVSSFVKRLDNVTLPRGQEKRMSNGGVDNDTQWIEDDSVISNTGMQKVGGLAQ